MITLVDSSPSTKPSAMTKAATAFGQKQSLAIPVSNHPKM
ncbi:hypothetical protein C4J95_2494 [Pseudomonas orientalis]|nr:hypothetical protein C4J95_2494 [Pseudomonas orientalis]